MNDETRPGPSPLPRLDRAAYRGYGTRLRAEPDDELTRVGPGTPCGEYLRRFWHPVALSSELADLPVALRILGEDLVVFRDGDGDSYVPLTLELVFRNLERLLDGKPLRNVVRPELGY